MELENMLIKTMYDEEILSLSIKWSVATFNCHLVSK